MPLESTITLPTPAALPTEIGTVVPPEEPPASFVALAFSCVPSELAPELVGVVLVVVPLLLPQPATAIPVTSASTARAEYDLFT